MKRKILRISPLPAAKLALVFWFISGAFITTLHFFEPTQGPKPPTWLFVTLPFFHALLGAALTLVLCVLYNFLAPRWSGIEVTVADEA
jgi:hypothetical protein